MLSHVEKVSGKMLKRTKREVRIVLKAPKNFEYQVDLFFIGKKDLKRQKTFRIGLVLIDVASKYATVIPIQSKEPPDVLAGMMEGLQN